MKVNGKCLHHKNKKHHSIKFATEKYNLKTSNEKNKSVQWSHSLEGHSSAEFSSESHLLGSS